MKAFLKRKNIVFSARRYGIDALGAMAQGLFCSLLIGTIVKTLGQQLGVQFLVDVGSYCSAMSGPAMALAIGYALQAPPLVLFSLATVGYAANTLGSTTLSGAPGAGGPLAVLFIAIIAAECGKAVSKETRVDILVTPLVTILVGVGLSALVAPAIGTAASAIGDIVERATVLQPFWMGILVSVVIGVALTLPIFLRRHLRGHRPDGSGGRRGGGRLLRPDGGLRRAELPGKPLGRSCKPGPGHFHAPDGQYRQESPDLDPRHPGLRHHRPHRHLRVQFPDERSRRRRGFRHGHLRHGGPHRRLRRVGQ